MGLFVTGLDVGDLEGPAVGLFVGLFVITGLPVGNLVGLSVITGLPVGAFEGLTVGLFVIYLQ